MISNAVGTELVSRITGYVVTKGNFNNVTPNLPQRVAIIGEANVANQAGLSLDPIEVTTAQQAGDLFGYGSPIHMAFRILRPASGSGIGGIPTVVYPQAEPGGAVAKEFTITVTGSATGNQVHTVKVAGRTNLDGVAYSVNVVDLDTPTLIAAKIADAVNAVIGSPFIATSLVGVVTVVSKWKGLTADDLNIEMDNNGSGVGVTYATVSTVTGAGTPSVAAALALFGNDWNTVVLNTYGLETTTMTALESTNGIPDPNAPTGRYSGIIFKPFIAISGSTADEDTTITDARLLDVTIAVAPAPLSLGHPLEAAANMTLLYARIEQDTPHLDVAGRTYSDMPTPASIGTMADYINRDAYVKKGNSTVDLVTGKYEVQDFVTTYHPIGEVPPQFRYCRNLMLDFNVRFGYFLLEEINVVDHVIAANDDIINVSGFIKPKQWKAILATYAVDLSKRALITEPDFMKDSTEVGLGDTNPDRLETFFRYKRSSFVRIASTTAEAGFNFGS